MSRMSDIEGFTKLDTSKGPLLSCIAVFDPWLFGRYCLNMRFTLRHCPSLGAGSIPSR